MLYLPFNVYLDSKRVSILIEVSIPIEAVLPTLPMLYLPFNVYLDSKRESIFSEAVLPTLQMLYLPFNVYLDSKRVSILIEVVLLTLSMLYLPFNVYLDSKRVSIFIRSSFANIIKCCTFPLMYILILKRVKHIHQKQFCQHYQMLYLPFNVYLDSKESKAYS